MGICYSSSGFYSIEVRMKKSYIAACVGVILVLAVVVCYQYQKRPKSFLKMTDQEILRCVAY